MSNLLSNSTIFKPNNEYVTWRNQFIFQRLRFIILLGIFGLMTFIGLNLSRYPEIDYIWLRNNLSQEIGLLICLGLLHLPFGHRHTALIFPLFSWSVTLSTQYWYMQVGIAKFDFVTWTLLFLAQATIIPVRWQLHLLSQVGLFSCFFALQQWTDAQLESQIAGSDPLFLYLYVFWFCAICNVSVYLYERLQRTEFETKINLQAEQQKSERLLLNILPHSIAKQLKQEHTTIAENFTEVTVLFADIVGFTEMSARVSPPKLVELLNVIFCVFDNLVEYHSLEKIKTIGDAYMVVAGLPTPCQNHTERIAELSLDMQQSIAEFNDKYDNNLSIRIGIHTGPVIAGVIGIKKFAYDLWGDTVNTASRMESHGISGEIQVSSNVYHILKDKYLFEERGTIQVKGKGEMAVYLLKKRLLS